MALFSLSSVAKSTCFVETGTSSDTRCAKKKRFRYKEATPMKIETSLLVEMYKTAVNGPLTCYPVLSSLPSRTGLLFQQLQMLRRMFSPSQKYKACHAGICISSEGDDKCVDDAFESTLTTTSRVTAGYSLRLAQGLRLPLHLPERTVYTWSLIQADWPISGRVDVPNLFRQYSPSLPDPSTLNALHWLGFFSLPWRACRLQC